MLFAEALILVALLTGFAIGKWYEHGRRGGTADWQGKYDFIRHEVEQRRLAAIAPVVHLPRPRVR